VSNDITDNNKNGANARTIWEQRHRYGSALTYARMMDCWVGSITALADALREVAPSVLLEAPIAVWRGGIVHPDDHPADIAIGLSWTTSLDTACWFATNRAGFASTEEKRGARPFVLATTATASEIIAFHEGRTVLTSSESEVQLDPAKLVTRNVSVAGTGITVAELQHDSRACRCR
jgi:hypothetical protein